MARTPLDLSFPPMDIRFWYGATTDCTVAHWNNDVAFEPWSKLYIPMDGQPRYAVARSGEKPVWTPLRPGQIYLIPGGRRQVNACRSGFRLVWVHFTVQDDGIGIAPQETQRVFERFFRGTGHLISGSGLGLAIVKEAAQRMGGSVELTQGLQGKGAGFVVRFRAQ